MDYECKTVDGWLDEEKNLLCLLFLSTLLHFIRRERRFSSPQPIESHGQVVNFFISHHLKILPIKWLSKEDVSAKMELPHCRLIDYYVTTWKKKASHRKEIDFLTIE